MSSNGSKTRQVYRGLNGARVVARNTFLLNNIFEKILETKPKVRVAYPQLNHIHCWSKHTQPNTKLYSKNIRKVEAESGCVRGSDSPFPQSRRHSVILFVTLLTRSHAAPDTSANLRPFWKQREYQGLRKVEKKRSSKADSME